MRLIVPSIDHRPASKLVGEPSAPHPQHEPSTHREPPASTPTIVEGGAAVRSASPPHRRRAAALIRQLGGRTEAELRRELDRFFTARPDLSDADRTLIARAIFRVIRCRFVFSGKNDEPTPDFPPIQDFRL